MLVKAEQVRGGRITTPPKFSEANGESQTGERDNESIWARVAQGALTSSQANSSRLEILASKLEPTPAEEIEFNLRLLAEPATNVFSSLASLVLEAGQSSGAESILEKIEAAAAHKRYRGLDFETRVVPQVNAVAQALLANHQELSGKVDSYLQTGLLKQSRRGTLLLSGENEETIRDAQQTIMTLGEVKDRILRLQSGQVENAYLRRSREFVDLAKRKAYSSGVSISQVVQAEIRGEEKALESFAEILGA